MAAITSGKDHGEKAGNGRGASLASELPRLENSKASFELGGGVEAAREGREPRSLRVLLVEDHASTRDILQRLLRKQGHQVVSAACVEEARKAFADGQFNVVISDLGLPDGTGWELMRHLHEKQPGLPGIALSGYGMENDRNQSEAAGFDVHLVKPVSMRQLEVALRRVGQALEA